MAIKLHQTTDARVWAQAFMERVEQGATVDEELMLAWFANALMCGWDHRARQAAEPGKVEV
jgi:hypothetical protein